MKIKIHVFHTGEVGIDPAVPFRDTSKNPISYTGLFQNPKRVKMSYLLSLKVK